MITAVPPYLLHPSSFLKSKGWLKFANAYLPGQQAALGICPDMKTSKVRDKN